MFIVTKEIDSENISKLCRTCLREDGDKMVCLFMGPAGSSLAAKLRSLSCLEVNITLLPKSLVHKIIDVYVYNYATHIVIF